MEILSFHLQIYQTPVDSFKNTSTPTLTKYTVQFLVDMSGFGRGERQYIQIQ